MTPGGIRTCNPNKRAATHPQTARLTGSANITSQQLFLKFHDPLRIQSMKNLKDHIGNQTGNLPACSTAHTQTTSEKVAFISAVALDIYYKFRLLSFDSLGLMTGP
jgi:hypothetical protein